MTFHEELAAARLIEDKNEQYRVVQQIFKGNRLRVSARVKSIMDAKQYPAAQIAKAIGINPAALSRSLANGFTIPPTNLVILSTICFEESCHETMFMGVQAPVVLPNHLANIAKKLSTQSCEPLRIILKTKMLELFTRESQQNLLRTLPMEDVIVQRLREMADDEYIVVSNIFGVEQNPNVKASIRKYLNSAYTDCGNIATLMFFAYAAQTALDYFIMQDYAVFSPIGYRDGNDIVTVENPVIRDFVSKFLRLSESGQTEALRIAFELIL